MCPHEIKLIKGYSLEDFYGEEWKKRYLDCINDSKISKKEVIIKDIIRLIIKSITETGTPFTFNRDIANIMNPNKHEGMIYSSNLCTEIMQNMSDFEVTKKYTIPVDGDVALVEETKLGDMVVCNLSSLVLGNIDVNNDNELHRIIKTQIRALDNVISLNYYPLENTRITNHRYRAIGLGTSGYNHMLANNKIHWESDKHFEFVDKVYEKINYYAIKSSMELAKERGSYPLFEGSEWETGCYFDRRLYISDEWNKLKEDINTYGIRNGYIMAVAPNGSTATIANTSEGIDPIMNYFFLEEKKGRNIPRIAPKLEENVGYYLPAHMIEQEYSLKANAIRQRHIDQGQSFNLYIEQGLKATEILNLFIQANKLGVKTIYYTRSKSLELKSNCESCSA